MRLCRISDLPEGSSRGFDPAGVGRDQMFVVRRHGVHAWRNACPHWDDTSMAWRKDAFLDAAGTHIVCAAHGARFDIATGVCTLGPCVGQALQRVRLFSLEDGFLAVALTDLETDK